MSHVQLTAEVAGEGPPLVILHGLLGQARNWGGLAKRFAQTHRVIVPDLRNHGLSPWADSMTYPEMAQDVAALIRREANGEPAFVLGHSMGGKVGMALALGEPGLVSKLIVADISPVRHSHGRFIDYVRAMRAIDASRLTRRGEADTALAAEEPDPAIRGFLLLNLQPLASGGMHWRPNLAAIEAGMSDILDWPDSLAGTSNDGPILFLAGGASDYVRDAHEPVMRAHFPAHRVQRLEGAGHWLHAEQPAAFHRAVIDFLAD